MPYREIFAVCFEIHTKHINTLCGKNVELLNVKPSGTYIVNTGLLLMLKWRSLDIFIQYAVMHNGDFQSN